MGWIALPTSLMVNNALRMIEKNFVDRGGDLFTTPIGDCGLYKK